MGAPLTLLRLCRLEWISRKIGVGRSLSDVIMSWLRLQTRTDCIPHPNHMYTKYFSILLSCGWAYGSARTLLLFCQVGQDFGKIRVRLSPSDVVRSCFRLQNRLECIQHPYYMYTKCFITLICCGWAYGSALTLLHLCRSGVEFRKIGGRAEPE